VSFCERVEVVGRLFHQLRWNIKQKLLHTHKKTLWSIVIYSTSTGLIIVRLILSPSFLPKMKAEALAPRCLIDHPSKQSGQKRSKVDKRDGFIREVICTWAVIERRGSGQQQEEWLNASQTQSPAHYINIIVFKISQSSQATFNKK